MPTNKKSPKKSAPKKETPTFVDAPEVVVKKVVKTIMDQCPEGRSMSDWCNYVSSNKHCFTEKEVTEARQHIQATQV